MRPHKSEVPAEGERTGTSGTARVGEHCPIQDSIPTTLVTNAGAKVALRRVIQASRTHADPRDAAELGRAAIWLQALVASDLLPRPGDGHG